MTNSTPEVITRRQAIRRRKLRALPAGKKVGTRPKKVWPKRSAAYWRERAAHKKAGKINVWVTATPNVIEAMLVSGLPEADSRDRKKVRRALEDIVQVWADKVLRK